MLKHGLAKTREYNIWKNMMRRCYNEGNDSYKYYGKRGIKVCDEWHDVEKFIKDIRELGYNDTLQIDRINVNGDYELDNVRFVTRSEQMRNMNKNIYITYHDETKTILEWSREYDVHPVTMYWRYHKGWDVEEIFSKTKTQSKKSINNRKVSKYKDVTLHGVTNKLSIWLEEKKLSYNVVRGRLYSGWSIEEALETPVGHRKKTNAL